MHVAVAVPLPSGWCPLLAWAAHQGQLPTLCVPGWEAPTLPAQPELCRWGPSLTFTGLFGPPPGQLALTLVLPPPVNCGWSSWSHWAECLGPCGSQSIQWSFRSSTNPRPSGRGQQCRGIHRKARRCSAPLSLPFPTQPPAWPLSCSWLRIHQQGSPDPLPRPPIPPASLGIPAL